MCLSTAYMNSGNEQKEIMKDIARIEAEDQGFWLINNFIQRYLEPRIALPHLDIPIFPAETSGSP
jgi:hypothetical protein